MGRKRPFGQCLEELDRTKKFRQKRTSGTKTSQKPTTIAREPSGKSTQLTQERSKCSESKFWGSQRLHASYPLLSGSLRISRQFRQVMKLSESLGSKTGISAMQFPLSSRKVDDIWRAYRTRHLSLQNNGSSPRTRPEFRNDSEIWKLRRTGWKNTTEKSRQSMILIIGIKSWVSIPWNHGAGGTCLIRLAVNGRLKQGRVSHGKSPGPLFEERSL